MDRSRRIQLINVGLALAFFGIASFLTGPILAYRAQEKFDERAGGGDELPIVYRMLNVMGGPVQGFLVASLASNAEQNKQDGRFFLANQQYTWITALQPRFPRVWMNLSWNMAYNISVATKSAEERWEWVNKGIEIIRNKAIPANAKSVELHRELVRLYFHKIGGMTDDANQEYKGRLALEWHRLMGSPEADASYDERIAWMKSFKDMHEAYGSDTLKFARKSEGLKALYDALVKAEFKLERLSEVERFVFEFGNLCIVNDLRDEVVFGKKVARNVNPKHKNWFYSNALIDVVSDEKYAQVLGEFVKHLRARVLAESYHMDIDFMWQLMARKADGGKEIGPLDWRHSATHGFYWASMGGHKASLMEHKEGFDYQNIFRDKLHTIQQVRNAGRVFFDPRDIESLSTVPMLEAIDSYHELYLEGRELIAKGEIRSSSDDAYMDGHENFLARSAVLLYTWGRYEAANKYFLEAKRRYGHKKMMAADGQDRYARSLEEFIASERSDNWQNFDNVTSDIVGILIVAYHNLYMGGNQEIYNRNMKDARYLYKKYMDAQEGTVQVGVRKRMALRQFVDLQADAYKRFFLWNKSDLAGLALIWKEADEKIQLRSFRDLMPVMARAARKIGRDPSQMFIPPKGLEAFEKARREATQRAIDAEKGIKRQ